MNVNVQIQFVPFGTSKLELVFPIPSEEIPQERPQEIPQAGEFYYHEAHQTGEWIYEVSYQPTFVPGHLLPSSSLQV